MKKLLFLVWCLFAVRLFAANVAYDLPTLTVSPTNLSHLYSSNLHAKTKLDVGNGRMVIQSPSGESWLSNSVNGVRWLRYDEVIDNVVVHGSVPGRVAVYDGVGGGFGASTITSLELLTIKTNVANLIEGFPTNYFILTTDPGNDIDDAADIAMLGSMHPFAANVLAVISTLTNWWSPVTIEAILRYYGHTDIPVGNNKDPATASDFYGSNIATNWFTIGRDQSNYLSGVALFRNALANAPSNSVKVISAGPARLEHLLIESGADSISPLTGLQLWHAKVKEWIPVAGMNYTNNGGIEYNVLDCPPCFSNLLVKVTNTITWVPYEAGLRIRTGSNYMTLLPTNNPLRQAFHIGIPFIEPGAADRPSWAQLGVLYATFGTNAGASNLFQRVNTGTNRVTLNGSNVWITGSALNQGYLVPTANTNELKDRINEWLFRPPLWNPGGSNDMVGKLRGSELIVEPTLFGSGRTGLGTNNPAGTLHVNGNMYFDNGGTLTNAIYLGDSHVIQPWDNPADSLLIGRNVWAASDSIAKRRIADSNSVSMTFNDGRIYFNRAVDVNATSGSTITVDNMWQFEESTGDAIFYHNIKDGRTTGGSLVHIGTNGGVASLEIFSTNANGVFKITSPHSSEVLFAGTNGNVGIGITPAYKFDVNFVGNTEPLAVRLKRDGGALVDPTILIEHAGTGDPSIEFLLTGDDKFAIGIDNSDGNKFKISAAATLGTQDRLVIDGGGNVGFGTNAPVTGQETFSSDADGIAKFGGPHGVVAAIKTNDVILGINNRLYVAHKEVTLTESTATTVANVTVASGATIGIRLMATTRATDGTDHQANTETIAIAAVNKAGTVTTTVSASSPSANLTSSGTLSTTWTAVANSNSIDIKNNAVSSLTQTALAVQWRVEVDSNGAVTVTPQ